MKNTNWMKTNNTAEQNRTRRTGRTSERGTSLIEIMVVLVIILVGLFLAMRVFPIGFGVLRANANRNTATQLAENMMSLVKGDAASMPDGVLFATTDGTPVSFKTNINPDNLGPCYVDTTTNNPCSDDAKLEASDNSYFTDVNKFRFIKGEAVKVPLPTPTAYGSGSLYTAKFGPLYMDPTVGVPTNAPTDAASLTLYNSFLKVYGAPLKGQIVSLQGKSGADLVGSIRDDQTYLIDYGNDSTPVQILLPPRNATAPARSNPTRTFSITLSYVDNGQIVTKPVDPIVVADGVADFQTITIGGVAINGAVPGSESVVRDFTRIASTATFDSGDAYQYKLLSSNVTTGESAAQANFGVIAFNPVGASSVSGGSSEQPFLAYLDYAVLDWHIIRDDRQVPSVLAGPGSTISIRTSIPGIKRIGEPEADSTFYGGIYGNTPTPNTEANPKDFQMFSLDAGTGQPLVGGNYNNGSPTPANADYYLNYDGKGGSYKTGVVYINANRLKPGSRIRIVYKAIGDWAVSFQKAYSHYNPLLESDGTVSAFPKPGAFGNFAQLKTFSGGKVVAAQIRFPYSDLNKSMVVTLQYTLPNGEVKRLSPVKVTADKFETDKTADITKYDQQYSYVNVRDIVPVLQQTEFDTATDWQVVGPVQGVSVKTRVIWHDNDTPNERWHVQDLDSYLTPATAQ